MGLMQIKRLHLSNISEEVLKVVSRCRIFFEESVHFALPSCTRFYLLLSLGGGELLSV